MCWHTHVHATHNRDLQIDGSAPFQLPPQTSQRNFIGYKSKIFALLQVSDYHRLVNNHCEDSKWSSPEQFRDLGSLHNVALIQRVWDKGQSSTFLVTFQSYWCRDNTLHSKAAWLTRTFSRWLSSLDQVQRNLSSARLFREQQIIEPVLLKGEKGGTNWGNIPCITQNLTGY